MGGLPGAGATVVNIRAGGRRRLSGTVHAVVLALLVAVFGHLAAWIPLSALGGILMVTAVTMVDFPSLRLIRKKHARLEDGRA